MTDVVVRQECRSIKVFEISILMLLKFSALRVDRTVQTRGGCSA